jgi:hypothetical protein
MLRLSEISQNFAHCLGSECWLKNIGLSDIRSDYPIRRTIWNFSKLHSLFWIAFYSFWVSFKSDYPMWSEYPMIQRLRNSMELESLWEDEILGSKITEYPIWHRTFRLIGLSEILQNFVLSLACLGVKNIGLSDVTSDFPRRDEKILSQRPHFRGFYKYPPPNPFLGLPNSFIHIHFGLSLVLKCFGSLSSLSLSQIPLCSLCSRSWWLWIWCLRA